MSRGGPYHPVPVMGEGGTYHTERARTKRSRAGLTPGVRMRRAGVHPHAEQWAYPSSTGCWEPCQEELAAVSSKFSGVKLVPFTNKKRGPNDLATHPCAQNCYSGSPTLATTPHSPTDTHAGNCSQFFLARLP